MNNSNCVIEKDPPMTQWQEAVDAAKSGRKPEARALFQKIVEQRPNDARVYHWLAFVTDSLPDKACHLRKVHKLDPDNVQAQSTLVKVLMKQGIKAVKEGSKIVAHQLFLETTQLEPRLEKAWFWLASVSENFEERLQCVERVLALNPDNARAKLWHDKLCRAVNSRTQWLCPLCMGTHPTPVRQCSSCGSITNLDRMDSFFEDLDVNTEMVGEALNLLKSKQDGAARYEDHYRLGLAYLNLGKHRWALKELCAAAELKPDNQSVGNAVAELRRHLADDSVEPPIFTEPAQAPKAKIMVVDDSSTVRKLVSLTLERHGYQVISASSGIQALARINETIPDLIFLDIKMPNLDGYQICKIIKENEPTKNIPVIMLSGQDGFFNRVRGRRVGAEEYITKPFESSTLLQALEKHCQK